MKLSSVNGLTLCLSRASFPIILSSILVIKHQILHISFSHKESCQYSHILDLVKRRACLAPKSLSLMSNYNVYLCPENQQLRSSTTNWEDYREYKSDPLSCQTCPLFSACTQSKNHQKLITRHLGKDVLEVCEVIRHQKGMKEQYQQRKEIIKRLLGADKRIPQFTLYKINRKVKVVPTIIRKVKEKTN